MIYKKYVSEPWFTLIKNGIKTVEGRLNKGDFAEMKKGDTVIWLKSDSSDSSDDKKFVRTRILDIHHYKSFHDYLKAERLKNTLPINSIKTIENGEKIYYQYYSKKDEKKYGVLAIKLKLI